MKHCIIISNLIIRGITLIFLLTFVAGCLKAQLNCSNNSNVTITLEKNSCNILLNKFDFIQAQALNVCGNSESVSKTLRFSDGKVLNDYYSFIPGDYFMNWQIVDSCGQMIVCPFTLSIKFANGISNCNQIISDDTALNTLCGNGDFESGSIDITEWFGCFGNSSFSGYGCYGSYSFSNAAITDPASRQTVIPNGIDPNVGLSTVPPIPCENHYSLRLGNMACGHGIEAIGKEFIVSSSEPTLSFWYAGVYQYSYVHTSGNAGFSVKLEEYNSGVWTNISALVDLGSGSSSLFLDPSSSMYVQHSNIVGTDMCGTSADNSDVILHKNWSCVNVNLSSKIGKKIRITFINHDCDAIGHWGYTYIDNVCTSCCSGVEAISSGACCSEVTSSCNVQSIQVQLNNGTITSASWNCGLLPTGYIDHTSFTFTPGSACPLQMKICVNPLTPGPTIVTYTVNLINGYTCVVKDTINCPCASVSGYVWYDENADGMRNIALEDGLNNCNVELIEWPSLGVNSNQFTAYDAGASYDGYYKMNCVKPGTYFVRFTPKQCFRPSPPLVGFLPNLNSDLTGTNGSYTTNLITIAPGDTKVYIDAGLYNCCDFAKVKSASDSCCSGITSKCEVTSVNVSITNGVFSSANWNCGALPNGYIGQTNYTFTPNTACALDFDICFNPTNANPVIITYTITLADGCICTKTDIKRCPCAYVSGVMWYDLDNDGINDAMEPALINYTVNLISCPSGSIVMNTVTTSPSGNYSFSCMPPGQYYVQFIPPPGYEPSPYNTTGPTTNSDIDHVNGTYNTDKFTVNNGDTINYLDAGLFNCCDFVIIEETNDSCCSRISSVCEVDSIKVNILNGTVSLVSWGCFPRLNNYAFTGLSDFTMPIPNNCQLSFAVCVNPVYTNPYAPVIVTYTVYSASGAVCVKSDTLFCPCAFISGEAWYDANGDGIYQQIENGINGMLIQLVDAMSGKTVSTMETITRPGTSSDDGYYEFPCVKPGMYYIRFDSLAGFTTSTPFQGGNAETDSDITGTYGPYTTYKITVMNGDTINNIDGGYKDSTSVSIGHLTIAGLIISETTKAMLPSRVNLATANNSNNKTEWSHYSGNYAFSDLTAGQDYRISVENNDAPLQGVSTRDIVLIQKHILGIKYLDSPYKIIAADVNNSQSITASDLVELRKLILGVIETFPKNKSWRFVPKNYVFKNPAYPFPFEENILHSKMENNKMNTDFYAVKIGDVSGNALGLVNTTTRSTKNVQLIFEKASYKKNEEISVPIRISEGDMLSGIQIALQLSDELEFVTIEKGSLNINQENYRFNRGQLLISYNEARGFDVGKKDIFTLRFKAKMDLNIDNKIRSSNLLENEAYDLTDQVVPLEVISSVENIKTTSGVYKFYPAKPNPFKQETMIEFELPNEEAIIFTVYNPEGKLVWSKEKIYIAGNNQMSISKEDLGHSGLYYLHIQSKEFCKTQRILMLN